MKHALTDISGIGELTAALLPEHGIDSVKTLRKGGLKKLTMVPGFGEKRAMAVLAAADELKGHDKKEKKATKPAEKKTGKSKKAKKGNKPKKDKKK